jgi:2-methylcitrate dehydratase PrpD
MSSIACPDHAPPLVSTDLVQAVAHFATSIEAARLPDQVIDAVKTNILDTLSCALAGSSAAAIEEISGLVREWAGAPQADVWCSAESSRPTTRRG